MHNPYYILLTPLHQFPVYFIFWSGSARYFCTNILLNIKLKRFVLLLLFFFYCRLTFRSSLWSLFRCKKHRLWYSEGFLGIFAKDVWTLLVTYPCVISSLGKYIYRCTHLYNSHVELIMLQIEQHWWQRLSHKQLCTEAWIMVLRAVECGLRVMKTMLHKYWLTHQL